MFVHFFFRRYEDKEDKEEDTEEKSEFARASLKAFLTARRASASSMLEKKRLIRSSSPLLAFPLALLFNEVFYNQRKRERAQRENVIWKSERYFFFFEKNAVFFLFSLFSLFWAPSGNFLKNTTLKTRAAKRRDSLV